MTPEKRHALYREQQWRCQHCGEKCAPIEGRGRRRLTVDHIVPKSKGGPPAMWNLAVLCSTCNEEKGDSVWPHLFTLPVPPQWQMFVRVSVTP